VQRSPGTEYAPFYAGYVALVPETDVLAVLEGHVRHHLRVLAERYGLPRERAGHGPGGVRCGPCRPSWRS
jgi:hypothetical protein